MFDAARRTTALSALLLSVFAGNAFAAGDRPSRPEAESCAAPEYPSYWQADGDSGNVTVAVQVDADGKVINSKVLSSSGFSRVDRASVKASARCKFKPAAKEGKAEPSWAKIQYKWIVE